VGVCAFPGIGNYEKSFPEISGKSGTALQLSNLQASVNNYTLKHGTNNMQ